MTLLFVLLACTGEEGNSQDSETLIQDSGTDDTADTTDTADTGEPGETQSVVVTENGDVRSFQVDGTSSELWIYVDLELGQVSEDEAWDLRVQRFTVEGSPQASIAWQPDEGFESLAAPLPGLPWDGRLDTWYNYDSTTHVLTPRAGIYAVESQDETYLLEMLDYYHPDSGSSGHPQFRVKVVDPAPESKVTHSSADGVRTTQVDSRDGLVTLRLASGAPASAENPELWELSFDRFNVAGEGVSVEVVVGAEFSSLTSVPSDAAFESTLADWYNYDGQTHTLSPKNQVYVVRAEVDYKLRFLDYYSDGESGFVSFEWAPLAVGL